MKQLLSFFLMLVTGFCVAQDDLYFPPTNDDPWETITPAEIGWCEDGLDTLVSFLDSKSTKAFIMLYQGKIVVEEYFDDFTADSLWVWNSAGKTVTATVVGIAQEEGLLAIDDPTAAYLGEGWTSATTEQELNITLRNQLSMTTGLNDIGVDVYCTDPSCLEYLDDAGERWAYHNGPYTLLQNVVEEASGLTMNLYTYLRLLQPTGMTGLFLPFGDNKVFVSTPRDMARFGLLMQNNGVWNGTPILDDPNYFTEMVNPSQDLNKSYGYLWWLNGYESYRIPSLQIDFPGALFPNAPQDLYAALGKDSQVIHVVPSEDLVLIRMGNSPDDSPVQLQFNIDLWEVLDFLICENPDAVDEHASFELEVFPNPVSDILTITGIASNTPWNVFDSAGKLIKSGSGTSLSVSELPSGSYLLSVQKNEALLHARFVVK